MTKVNIKKICYWPRLFQSRKHHGQTERRRQPVDRAGHRPLRIRRRLQADPQSASRHRPRSDDFKLQLRRNPCYQGAEEKVISITSSSSLLFVTKNCCIFMNFCRHLSHQNKSKLNTYIPTKKYFVYIRDPPEKPWFFLLPSFAILFSQSCLTTLTKSISSSLRSFIQRYA